MTQDAAQTVDPRVLGQRLQAARKRRDLTQQAVADSMHLARTTIVAIEKGERLPKDEELLQFSELYQRTVSELLRPYAPSEPLIVQFRANYSREEMHDGTIEPILQEFQKLCDDYLYLEQLLSNPLPQPQIPLYAFEGIKEIPPERLGQETAGAERNRLGLGDAPILNLAETLEKEGIRIFQLDLPAYLSGFFGYNQSLGPCIAINRNHPPERRQWSLAHEYAHFLSRRHHSTITFHHNFHHIPENERFADAFAKTFLMPSSSLSRQFFEMKRQRGTILPADIVLLAHYFFVSFEAMARRLEDLRLIRSGVYDTIIHRGFKPQTAQSLLAVTPHAMSDDLLPLRYTYLAIEAYSKGLITEEDLADFLHVGLAQARDIFLASHNQLIVGETGETATIEIPFNGDLSV